MLLWCHSFFFFFLWHLIYFWCCGIMGMRDQTDNLSNNISNRRMCVWERERESCCQCGQGNVCSRTDCLISVESDRLKLQLTYFVKLLGTQTFVPEGWRKWLEFCQMTTAPAWDTGWKAAGWLFLFAMICPSKIINKTSDICWYINCSLAHELLLGCFWNFDS